MSFSDIEKHWSRSAVYQANAMEFISGYPDGSFKPEQYLTRLEALVLFMRAAGYKLEAKTNNVNKPSISAQDNVKTPVVPWGQIYLDRAAKDQLLNEEELSKFTYNTPASREETVKILVVMKLPLSVASNENAKTKLTIKSG
jgi:hypothetical protein